MATGYVPSVSGWESNNSLFTGWIRLAYSTTFDSSTRKSTVTITPQFKSSADMGNDYRFFDGDGMSGEAGVYANGTKLFSFGTDFGYGDFLTCGSATNSWANLSQSFTFTISHNNSGVATFTAGIYCSVLSMYTVESWAHRLIRRIGSTTSDTITVQEAAKTYTVTYNKGANGTGTNTTATKTYNVALTLKGAIFTRTGYTQDGWSTTDGGSKAYDLSGSYTTNAAVTLYPHWSINTYTLTLSKGNYIASVSGGGTKNYNASVTAVATLGSATGYTYSFTGWYQGDTRKSTSLSYTFNMPNSNLTLTAKGSRTAHTYSVKFNKNSDAATGSMSNESFTYGVEKALTQNAFSRTGYSFLGWATSSSGSVVYSDKQTVINLTATDGGTVNLYAVWGINSYTLTLSKGNYIASVSGGGSKNYNASVTVTATLSSNATGYTNSFDGWYQDTTKKSSNLSYTFNMPNSNLTLVAKGKTTANTYTVVFNPKGGSGTMANESFTYDVEKALTSNAFTKTGYTFKGWDTSSSATTVVYTNGKKVKNLATSGTVNLYAVWEINSYTLTLSKGDYIASVSGGGTKNYNASVTATATLGSATGYTYSFTGWYDGTTRKSTSLSYTFNMPASALTLTAKGSRTANTYTVTFNPKGGSGTMAVETFTYDVSKGLTTNAFTKDGYTFKGWDTNSSGSTVVYTNGQSVKNLATSGNVNLYAVWEIITYTISYNANGGSGAPSSQTKTWGVDLTLRTSTPTKSSVSAGSYSITYDANGGTVSTTSATANRTTSYSFYRWNTKSDGTGTSYSAGGTYTANASATLYARYSSTTTTASVTLPTPTRTGYTFKGWATSSSATTGQTGTYTPTGNVTLYAIWQVKTYTLTISQGTGSTIVVKREGVTLSNNATISHFDILSITISANTGYTINKHTVNGSNWTSGNYTVSGNVSVISTATIITYTLSVTTSNEGVTTSISRGSSPIGGGSTGTITNGATLYYNDVISINYTIGGAYQLLTAKVNNTDISSQSLPYSVTVRDNVVVSITVKLGAIVYIGNEPYQVYIGDGTNWNQYQAYIGNGSSFDQY